MGYKIILYWCTHHSQKNIVYYYNSTKVLHPTLAVECYSIKRTGKEK
jgi:hypothetical protein